MMPRTYAEAQNILSRVFQSVRNEHGSEGIGYIRAHWQRYIHVIMRLPPLSAESRVLEIGASIISNVIRAAFHCTVETVYHELEPEWHSRYEKAGIRSFPVDLLRDPLPVTNGAFDCILLDQVLEHLPVSPGFLFRQCIGGLAPEGLLLIAVPNFAVSEKRLALLCGKNPQDQMDERFIYYAHHREPVMQECIDLVRHCGGIVDDYEWLDFDAPKRRGTLWYLLRCLKHGELHRIVHCLVPSMRSYLFLRIRRDPSVKAAAAAAVPPLQLSNEFGVGIVKESAVSPENRPAQEQPVSRLDSAENDPGSG